MKINKASFNLTGDSISIKVPLTKVNAERREVSGFATLDNVDTQDDIVLPSASLDAFQRARGNVREQHDKHKAVGRLTHFEEKTFYGDDGSVYRGIYVTVYISKGAQDTWEKCLDGTLSGFSIGGAIVDFKTEWRDDLERWVRIITKYDLDELSIVDNPANQLANVFAIHKNTDGSVEVKGMVAETISENIFWCKSDSISQVVSDDDIACPICEDNMQNIGYIDKKVNKSIVDQIEDSISNFLDSERGGKEMADTVNEDVKVEKSETVEGDEVKVVEDETTQVESVEEEGANDESTEETEVEKSETVEEVETEDELEKAINELKDVVSKSTVESREIVEKANHKLEEEINKVTSIFEEEIGKVNAKFEELSKKLEAVRADNEETRKSLETLSNTAFRKSGDVEAPKEEMTKSVKGGTFSGVFLPSTDDL